MPANMKKAGIKYNGGGQPVINHMGMKVPGMTYDTGGAVANAAKQALLDAQALQRQNLSFTDYLKMRNEEDKAMKAPGSETLAKFGGTPKMKTGGNPVQKIKKAVSAVKNFFSKKPKVNKNVIDDTNVGKLLFRGVNRKGESTFKVGTSGKVLHESSNILPRSQKFQNLLKNWKKTTK